MRIKTKHLVEIKNKNNINIHTLKTKHYESNNLHFALVQNPTPAYAGYGKYFLFFWTGRGYQPR